MIPGITALVGLILGLTVSNILIPGIIDALPGTHALSALITTFLVWGSAIGVATFGYLAAKRI